MGKVIKVIAIIFLCLGLTVSFIIGMMFITGSGIAKDYKFFSSLLSLVGLGIMLGGSIVTFLIYIAIYSYGKIVCNSDAVVRQNEYILDSLDEIKDKLTSIRLTQSRDDHNGQRYEPQQNNSCYYGNEAEKEITHVERPDTMVSVMNEEKNDN